MLGFLALQLIYFDKLNSYHVANFLAYFHICKSGFLMMAALP